MKIAAFLTGLMIMVCGAFSAQSQPGQIWFELPEGPCQVGLPYTVIVHLNAGNTNPYFIDFTVEFDPAYLDLAYSTDVSGGPFPIFVNPDLELGETLQMALIDDLEFVHLQQNPGRIHVVRVGQKKSASWPLTGDIELLEITFHPRAWATGLRLGGTLTALQDEFLEDIGDPAIAPSFLAIEGEEQPLPAAGTWALLVLILALAAVAVCSKQYDVERRLQRDVTRLVRPKS